jgi:hypothetical protein
MTGKWLSKPAVLWVLDEAGDIPPRLVATLIAVARYADSHGRGAHPSAATIAAHIRKNERNTKKDLAELQRLGLLLPGDQRTVASIRADRRPFVYDLPMPRGVAEDTPSGVYGVSQMASRGVAESPNGVSHATPEEVLKTSGNGVRDRAGARTPPAEPQFRAPPCPVCGKPFSQEQLADPDFREMALAGDVIHSECMEEDDRLWEAAGRPGELA